MVELNEYTCRRCGDNQLTYRKWVESKEDVVIYGNCYIEYCQAVIDIDNDLGAWNGYRCQNCGHALSYYGSVISNEKDLLMYLKLTQEERGEDEYIYREMLREQMEKERSCGIGGTEL